MAQTIKLKRTATPNNVPTTAQLELGEIAVNTYDGKVYIKKNDGAESIVEVTNSSLGNYLPLAGGTLTGNLAINNGSPELYFGTTGNHYNWRIAAQELVDAGFEIAVGSQDTDYSNDTYVNKFVVKASGNVGIGESNPQELLHLTATTPVFRMQGGSRTYQQFVSGTDFFIRDVNAGLNRVTLNSSGNVGMGITPNTQRLTLGGQAHTRLQVDGSSSAGVYFTIAGANGATIRSASTNQLEFYTTGLAATIDSSGRVGIGTSSPASALDIIGANQDAIKIRSNVAPENYYQIGRNQSTGLLEFKGSETTYNGYLFKGPSSDLMTINASGRVGIGTSSPQQLAHINGTGISYFRATGGTGNTGIDFGQHSNGNGYIWHRDSTSLIFGTAATERMRIDSSGNVGIGTSSPVNNVNRKTLALQGVWGGQLDIMVGSTVHAQFGTDNFASGQSCRIQSQDGIVFKAGGTTERMRIDSTGNVGIGDLTPSVKLDVYQGTVGIGAADFRHVNGNRILINPSYNYYDAYNHIFRGLNGSSTHMTIDVNGNVGIGTSLPEAKLDVKSTLAITEASAANSNSELTFYSKFSDSQRGYVLLRCESLASGSSDLAFRTRNNFVEAERMRISSSGNLLVGTTTAYTGGKLSVNGGIVQPSGVQNVMGVFGTSGLQMIGVTGGDNVIGTMGAAEPLVLRTGSTERLRIDPSGNVGIGVVPSAWAGVTGLQLSSGCSLNGSGVNAVLGANSYYDGTNWKYIVSAFSTNYYLNYANDGSHVWQIAPSGTAGDTITYTHAMTLNASGNLLVGKTSNDSNVEGAVLYGDSATGASAAFTSDGNRTIIANRKTDDGEIISIRKDGTSVGVIGTKTSMLTIGSGDVGLYFDSANNRIIPFDTTTQVNNDAVFDIGAAAYRIKDLYLSGSASVGSVSATGNITANGVTIGASDVRSSSGVLTLGGTSEAMRIDSSGNVGIGTSSPSRKLHVKESGSFVATFEGGTNAYTSWSNSTGTAGYIGSANGLGSGGLTDLGVRSENNLIFLTNAGSERMRIDSSGNIGIGITNPTTKLHVAGIVQVVESSNTAFYGGDYVRVFGSGQEYGFRNTGGTTKANISMSGNSYFNGGNVGIGTSSPAAKAHIVGAANAIALKVTNAAVDGNTADVVHIEPSNGAYYGKLLRIQSGRSDFSDSLLFLNTTAGINGTNGSYMRVQNNLGADIFRIKGDGNVGIGTSTPVSKLHVSGNITIDNSSNAPYLDFVENGDTGDSKARIAMDQISGTAGQMLFYTEGSGTLSERMRIDSSRQRWYRNNCSRSKFNCKSCQC
jgi:hypothetical protein